jgi:hypothetical protein
MLMGLLLSSALPAFAPAEVKRGSFTVQFADVTRAAGIDFHLTCGGAEKRYILESLCGGVAFLDYENDGWLEILLEKVSTLED